MVSLLIKNKINPEKLTEIIQTSQAKAFKNIKITRLLKKLLRSRGIIFLLTNLFKAVSNLIELMLTVIYKNIKRQRLRKQKTLNS
jgi:Trm5-related predicted tRNA methylase